MQRTYLSRRAAPGHLNDAFGLVVGWTDDDRIDRLLQRIDGSAEGSDKVLTNLGTMGILEDALFDRLDGGEQLVVIDLAADDHRHVARVVEALVEVAHFLVAARGAEVLEATAGLDAIAALVRVEQLLPLPRHEL